MGIGAPSTAFTWISGTSAASTRSLGVRMWVSATMSSAPSAASSAASWRPSQQKSRKWMSLSSTLGMVSSHCRTAKDKTNKINKTRGVASSS